MQCQICEDVKQSVCCKIGCRSASGEKSKILPPAGLKKEKNVLVNRKLYYDYSSSSGSNSDMEYVDNVAGKTPHHLKKELYKIFKPGDYIQVISGHYSGYYASVLGEAYGNEI